VLLPYVAFVHTETTVALVPVQSAAREAHPDNRLWFMFPIVHTSKTEHFENSIMSIKKNILV